MMRTSNTVLATLLMIFTAALLSATDFGLELKNTGGIEKIEDAEFYTDHKATLWATIPFNNANSNSLAIEGSFYASKPAGVDEFDYYVDVDLFRFTVTAQQNEQGKIVIDAGRFPVTDATGILRKAWRVEVRVSGHQYSFFAGYTGLLNARQEKTHDRTMPWISYRRYLCTGARGGSESYPPVSRTLWRSGPGHGSARAV